MDKALIEKEILGLEISDWSKDIIRAFIDRGIYNTPDEVINVALNLLLDKRLDEESANYNKESEKEVDEYLLKAQMEVLEGK